jgi:hypothetical protein
MTRPDRSLPRVPKKSASPAERSEEFTEIQRRLKAEAAERRLQAKRAAPSSATRKPR